MPTIQRPRLRARAVAGLVAAGLLGLSVATTTPAQADPVSSDTASSRTASSDSAARAGTTVSPVPAADLAQAATPNPAVGKDRIASFTYTSSTARAVSVVGSFGPSDAAFTVTLSPSATGTFTGLVGPLRPGLYTYRLLVDGKETRDPANPNVVHSDPELTTFLVKGKDARFLTKRDVAHGKLTTLTYPSGVTGTDRRATVWTPPGYARSTKAYPTLYLVHGGGGDYLDWMQQGRANVILDNLYAQGKIAPMVVVMPDGNVPGWVTWPQNEDEFTTDLLEDLVPAVRANYQVSRSRSQQALAGLSQGGGQTLNAVIANPGEFRYVGVLSSGYFATQLTAIDELGVLDKATVRRLNKRTELMRIYIGNRTDIAYQNNVNTRELFDQKGLRYDFAGVYPDSGHTWRTWQRDLRDFAPRIF